jgi:hypothetical protein
MAGLATGASESLLIHNKNKFVGWPRIAHRGARSRSSGGHSLDERRDFERTVCSLPNSPSIGMLSVQTTN